MLHFEDAKEYSKSAAVRAFYANKQFEHTYTAGEKSKAASFKDVLDLAYKGTVYVNYRAKFIAVKLARGALVRDKKFKEEIVLLCKERGYAVVDTPQGTIYRIARQA